MSFIKNKAFLAVALIVIVFALVFVIRNGSTGPTSQAILNTEEEDSGVTREELSAHNKLEDCWVSYDGKVYDLTSFLPGHPGRPERILPYCGTAEEFKAAFEKKHGTTKVEMLMKVGTFMGDLEVVGNLNLN